MKGLVFTHYLDFIESTHGYDLVDQILEKSDLESNGAYTSVGTYPYGELVQLLTHTSSITGQTVPDLVKAFGYHLAGVFQKAYPSFFEDAADSFHFIASVHDKIHPQVLKLYPEAELPYFDVEYQDETTLKFTYRSSRAMADLAEGIIMGCLDHFGEQAVLHRENSKPDGTEVKFVLRRA